MRADYRVRVPEGVSGNVRVERFTVTDAQAKFGALRAAIGGSGRYTPAGTYTRLVEGGLLWMSDTPDEASDHYWMIHEARGRVLIHGLGIGLAVRAVLLKTNVEHVTVVEKNADVIALAGPHYRRMGGKRITILHDDAFTWALPKGARWDVAWHDIWPTICADNIEQIVRLKKRFARRVEWQGAWCEYQARRLHRGGY